MNEENDELTSGDGQRVGSTRIGRLTRVLGHLIALRLPGCALPSLLLPPVRSLMSQCAQDLARSHPTEITVLNKFAFFWPIWSVSPLPLFLLLLTPPSPSTSHRHDDHLRLVHRSLTDIFHRPSPLAPTYDTPFTYHLWESVSHTRYLSPYDPDRIHNRGAKTGKEREEDGASDENAFSREGRRYVSREMRIAWRAARERGDVER
jgi:hypothetical protein